MPSQTVPSDSNKTKERVQRALDTTISTINFAKEVVPVELARTALTSMATLLSVIRDTMKNSDEFAELEEECREIALIVWDLSKDDGLLDPLITKAIQGVTSTVDHIRDEINDKAARGIASKLFAVSADKEDIARWKESLTKCLDTFNTRLNISTNINLAKLADELNELRLAGAQERNPDLPLRQPLPAKPPIFFGRDALLASVIQMLLRPSHVALLGAGGIGKTSLAKATLSDPSIAEAFGNERYFISFDALDRRTGPSTFTLATLIDRLGGALGLKSAKADMQKLIMWKLQSVRALLVLDNAETILDGDGDVGSIMALVDEIGAVPSVTLLLTTRSAALPPNLLCETVHVPSLELSAARQAFGAIFRLSESDASSVDDLLEKLDCHPLSVNLLAQAARQNQWTVQELSQAWQTEKTRVLHTHSTTDAGKNQNLATSIELTLHSRAFKAVNPTALHVLQVIAFFPAGVNKRKVKELFPSVQNLQSVIGTLCKLSLTYYNGDFLTMLAPIRFHILSTHGESCNDMPLFADVRRYYQSHLERYGALRPDRAPDFTGAASWLAGDDGNAEYVAAYDLDAALLSSNLSQIEYCCRFCNYFIAHLLWSHPRHTLLQPRIKQLPRHTPRRILGVSAGPLSRTNRLLATMAMSFFILGDLAGATAAFDDALELYDTSIELARELGIKFGIMRATHQKGEVFTTLGNFPRAEASFKTAIDMARKARDIIGEAHIMLSLSMLTAFQGGIAATEMSAAARDALVTTRRKGGFLPHAISVQGYIAYFAGDNSAAKTFFQELVDVSKKDGSSRGQFDGHVGLAAVAQREDRVEDAVIHLDKARDLGLARMEPQLIANSLAFRASMAANAGEFATARAQMSRALEECASPTLGSTFIEATILYLSARVELLAMEYHEARNLFNKCIGLFDALSDVRFRARVFRALGEINLLLGEVQAAFVSFEQAHKLCVFMNIQPRFLYVCFDCFALPDQYTGWTAFLRGVQSRT